MYRSRESLTATEKSKATERWHNEVVGAKVCLREGGNRGIGDNPFKKFCFKGEQRNGAVTREEVGEQSNIFLR